MKLFETYLSLSLDGSLFGFEKGSAEGGYYCTPARMTVLGWDNGIHFGTIEGYGETIFAVNPEAYGLRPPVFPMAENFRDFLSLLLSAGHTAALEQIVSFPFTREQYEKYVSECVFSEPFHADAMARIEKELQIEKMPDAYGYVTALQKRFDAGALLFSEEYYDTIGEEVPTACKRWKQTETDCDLVSISVCMVKKKEEDPL